MILITVERNVPFDPAQNRPGWQSLIPEFENQTGQKVLN